MLPARLALTVVVSLFSVAILNAEVIHIALRSQGNLHLVPRTVLADAALPETVLASLAAGPSPAEQAAGIWSALPTGTELTGVTIADMRATVDFTESILADGIDEERSEAIYEQVRTTLALMNLDISTAINAAGAPLYSYLPPVYREPPPPDIVDQQQESIAAGTALNGKKISMSPGHGLVWNGSSWGYERGIYCSPLSREDLHNIDLVAILDTYLLQDGATTRNYRCINKSYGNYTTGEAWWHMSGSYWLKHLGYPCSVYASYTGDCNLGTGSSESSDSIRSRPLASDYDNTDLHIAMHTNGYTGDCTGPGCPNGTLTGYDLSSSEHAAWGTISRQLAQAVNDNLVSAIRTHYDDTTWRNRGIIDDAGGSAETRIPNRAAILIEVAFHDTCDRDGLYLQDNFFRCTTMWGVYKGVCQYLGVTPTYDFYSDEYVSDTIPTTMTAGQSYNVGITFRNRGVLWNSARGFKLGAVGESDPFTSSTRVALSGEVWPNTTRTFNLVLTAPATAGTYTTDWRMLREGVTWFGATCTKQVQVNGGGPQAPNITAQPSNSTMPLGGTAIFTVAATGEAPLAYQWQKNSADIGDEGDISGAHTNTLRIANTDYSDVGNYRCKVTNAVGNTTSNDASLTVVSNEFMVESRTGGQHFDHYNETGVWANAGKSSASGTTSGIGARYGSTYRSVAGEKHALFKANIPVAGQYEVFTTWAASVNRRNPILHRITRSGGTTDVNVDQSATADVWVSLGTYQFNAGDNAGQVDISNLNIDASGSMYADAVKWVYVPPPLISQHPAAAAICPGASVQFTVTASGVGTITYQWQKNGTDLSNGGHYAGATTATLTVSSVDATDAADYRCVVTNAIGSNISSSAALTLKAATTITAQPETKTVLIGEATTFTVEATGEGSLSYQWRKDGVDLTNGGRINGVGTATLNISDCQENDAGEYRCVVAGGCGSGISSEAAHLTVTLPPIPGDYDQDRDVDMEDFAILQSCLTGLGIAPTDPSCVNVDLDGVIGLDVRDVDMFRMCMSGPDIPGNPNCLPQ